MQFRVIRAGDNIMYIFQKCTGNANHAVRITVNSRVFTYVCYLSIYLKIIPVINTKRCRER